MNGSSQMAGLKLALTNLCSGRGKILWKLLLFPWLTAVVFSISVLTILRILDSEFRESFLFLFFSDASPLTHHDALNDDITHRLYIGVLVQRSFCLFLCLGSVTQCSLIWKNGNKNQKSHNDWWHTFIINRRQESNYFSTILQKWIQDQLDRWDSKSRILHAHTS